MIGLVAHDGAGLRFRRRLDVEDLLALARRGQAVAFVDHKTVAVAGRDQQLAAGSVGEQSHNGVRRLEIGHEADRLAVTAAAGKLRCLERVELPR